MEKDISLLVSLSSGDAIADIVAAAFYRAGWRETSWHDYMREHRALWEPGAVSIRNRLRDIERGQIGSKWWSLDRLKKILKLLTNPPAPPGASQ